MVGKADDVSPSTGAVFRADFVMELNRRGAVVLGDVVSGKVRPGMVARVGEHSLVVLRVEVVLGGSRPDFGPMVLMFENPPAKEVLAALLPEGTEFHLAERTAS